MTRLEHVGVAVDDADGTLRILTDILGEGAYKQETVSADGIRTHFISTGCGKLELLESLSNDSPVQAYLDARGPGLHHLAFEVADIDAAFARARERGYDPIDVSPRPGADGKRIFFLHPRQTGRILIEFCQQSGPLLVERDAGTLPGVQRWSTAPGSDSKRPVLHLHGDDARLDAEVMAEEMVPQRAFHSMHLASSAAVTDLLDHVACGPCHLLIDPAEAFPDLRWDDPRIRSMVFVDALPQTHTAWSGHGRDLILVCTKQADALDRMRVLRELDRPPQFAAAADASLQAALIGRYLADRD